MMFVCFCLFAWAVANSQAATVPPSQVFLFDLRYTLSSTPADSYENSHLVAALQGLVNRDGPQLYTFLTDADDMWFSYLTAGWMNATRFTNISSVEQLVAQFASYFNGVVLYDPQVYSTSLVASTVAGVDNLLPVCFRTTNGSLYQRLVAAGPQLPVKLSLVGRFNGSVSGSAKCDAYLWAKANYLDNGRCNPTVMGYFLDYYWVTVAANSQLPYDVNTVTNQDWFIAQRGFFWDLDVWPVSPNDDPHQPPGTDRNTMIAILLSAYQQTNGSEMIHIGGFVPWAFKYCDNGEHNGVATEWETVRVTTAYNAYLDADACCVQAMANAAFYQHYPLAASYKQNPPPTESQLQQMGYLLPNGQVAQKTFMMFYVGDYDSAAWLYSEFKGNWDDPARGSVPLGWGVNPNLQSRIPMVFDHIFNTLTPNDRIITGDSGAGYLNPTQLFVPRQVSGLPAADQAWVAHCAPLYEQFDMTFTGFLINGASGPMTNEAEQMYLSFSPDGMVEQWDYAPDGGVHLQGNAPVFMEQDIPGDPSGAASYIQGFFKPNTVQFQVYRSILQPASFYQKTTAALQALNPDIVVVEPLVLSALARIELKQQQQQRSAVQRQK